MFKHLIEKTTIIALIVLILTSSVSAKNVDGGQYLSFILQTATVIHETYANNAYNFLIGDLNRDGKQDVYILKRTSTANGKTEVHVLNGANNYQTYLSQSETILHDTGDNLEWAFGLGDCNRDGVLDLYAIRKSGTASGKTEVYVLDGANNFQSYLLQIATVIHETGSDNNWKLMIGDYNRDAKPDLYVICKSGTATGMTEAYVLNGSNNFQSYLLQVPTALHSTNPDNTWDFILGDFDGIGNIEIIAIKKQATGTETTELHVLNGSSNYSDFIFQGRTSLHELGNDFGWSFGLSDYNGDTKPDLFIIKKAGTSTGKTEIHILNGAFTEPQPITEPEEPQPPIGGPIGDVPFMSQVDPVWKNVPLNRGVTCPSFCRTIGNCGCTLTSATMTFSYYGAAVNPIDINNCLGSAACGFKFKAAVNCSQGKVSDSIYNGFSWNNLSREINEYARPVLLGMELYESGKKTKEHWVVVVSGSGSDPSKYYINDPAYIGGKNMRLSFYTTRGWRLSYMYSYIRRTNLTSLVENPYVSPRKIDYPLMEEIKINETIAPIMIYSADSMTMIVELDKTNVLPNAMQMGIYTDLNKGYSWQPYSQFIKIYTTKSISVVFRANDGSTAGPFIAYLYPEASPFTTEEYDQFLPLIGRN